MGLELAATDCKSSSLTARHAVDVIHHCLSSPRAWLLRRSWFYLGYLTGRSSPSPPPKKNIYCYHYSIQVTISEKSSRRDEVSAHEKYSPSNDTIVSQYAPDCISYSFQKISGDRPPDPPRKLVAARISLP